MYFEHVDEGEFRFFISEGVIEYSESEEFLIDVHEVIVGIEVFGDFADLGDYFF